MPNHFIGAIAGNWYHHAQPARKRDHTDIGGLLARPSIVAKQLSRTAAHILGAELQFVFDAIDTAIFIFAMLYRNLDTRTTATMDFSV